MPTPSSRMVSDCSNNSQSMPRARNISAVVRPPMPPPTMIAFMRVTPHSLPQPRLAPLAGRGRIASAMRSIVRCDPGEGVQVYQPSAVLAVRAPHPDPLRASFARLDPVRTGGRPRRQLDRLVVFPYFSLLYSPSNDPLLSHGILGNAGLAAARIRARFGAGRAAWRGRRRGRVSGGVSAGQCDQAAVDRGRAERGAGAGMAAGA